MRKVAGKHPGLTDCPSSDPPQLPKSQNNYLALPDSRGQSKQGQWAINHPGLFSQLFGRNSEWKENGLLCIGFLLAPREADWPSSAAAATLSWEKITEAGWIPDNLVEIKSCLIQFLSKYWKHFEFPNSRFLCSLTRNTFALQPINHRKLSRWNNLFPDQVVHFPVFRLLLSCMKDSRAVFNQKVHGDSGWWISPKRSNSRVPGMITRSYFWSEKLKEGLRGLLGTWALAILAV